MDKKATIRELRDLEGHLVLLVLMPGYKQGRIGQLTYQDGTWLISNLYDEEALPIRVPVDRVVKVAHVQTWDVHDAVITVRT